MGKTIEQKYTISAGGRANLREKLNEHHDDQWICERTDHDDTGCERKSYYLELTAEEFEQMKWCGMARVERTSPHR